MVNYNKNILRSLLITSYLLLIAIVIYGVSALFGYLNTGADRSSMLHIGLQKKEHYNPKVIWSPLENEGRSMNQETLNALERDYLNAWYVRHIAYKTNTSEGIKDYYTDNARKNLYRLIELNSEQNISTESTTLKHHPTLEFFSEDGQLAVITDRDVVEYKRVYQDEKLILETNEISTYQIIFLLEDGFWRIRHMVKEITQFNEVQQTQITTDGFNLKGINYYPQATPWDMFGESFSEDIIAKDFKIIKDAGLNSIRIFVQYGDFGKELVNQVKLEKLIQTLDIAAENDLKVIVTLFDFYGDYSVLNWTFSMQHAEVIVSALKGHKGLLAWDIKNEPNLDFESRGKQNVVSWLENMINFVKTIDTKHPITIGWSNTQNAILLKDKVDFVTFHYYEDIEALETSITALRTEIPNKPLVMGEFGISSYSGLWMPFGHSEKIQAEYHKKAQEIIADNDLQFMSWTLYDFVNIPKEVAGSLPWRKNLQKYYGFIDKSGIKKAAFKYISTQ